MVPIMLQLLLTLLPACLKVLLVVILVKVIRNRFREFTTTRDEYLFNYKYDENQLYISVENVGKCLHAMKPGKAAGCDGTETEHVLNAHPILVSILGALFNAMLQHGYVPDNFGRGIIIRLIKNNSGDALKSIYSRGITLSSNISKLFEMCVLDLFDKYLASSDLQFGFKKGVGCRMLSMPCNLLLIFIQNMGLLLTYVSWICQKPLIKLNIMVCT